MPKNTPTVVQPLDNQKVERVCGEVAKAKHSLPDIDPFLNLDVRTFLGETDVIHA